ncbi:putrescine ABC transporter ATP binding subunit [Rhodovastum atsumiense]|uniref:ABC transporter ATP-binding protein n=1 Tax=Rhodovastum atsumiense TaxID=504468 RepID=A0A5M6IP87_9PROT|nr:ABC transporter ATP-binding protein [Rhodovastum atsumiense]KAA5610082.1 ABC transporter ATP-binding protein [Rhodovastum atsumiense]CAH2601448.1 putrescine ABC transporter ATP binding subunit [Rhodovastum atsumiense]
MAAVSIRGLRVRYGTAPALDGLDLDIASGEILVLLGASGSGKTTLLRVAGGFLAPDSGTIALDGQDVTALPPHRRPVNTMFQSYALFPHMTVAGNVAYGLRRQGLRGPALAARVEELLALVRLEGFGGRRIQALSGGQQQRVALARALAPRPQLLLLDEPLSALDRGLREETRADLVSLLRRTGTTAILVTHDQDEALATADRLAVLNRGRLEQVGPPAELYERPATRYVASFLGAANLLEAVVAESGPGVTRLRLGCGSLVAAAGSALAPGSRVTLALRPERLRLDTDGDITTQALAGTVTDVTYRGSTLELALRLADGAALRVSRPLGEGAGPALPRPGDPLRVRWSPAASMLLTQ